MTKDEQTYLRQILDAIDAIERYTASGRAAFYADEQKQDAVIYNLAIIGEIVKRLPVSLRSAHPEIPWRSIAGLRDIVIHDYDSTEIPRIWNVIEHDLPPLRRTARRILRDRRMPRKRAA